MQTYFENIDIQIHNGVLLSRLIHYARQVFRSEQADMSGF